MNTLEDRVLSEAKSAKRIKNSDLICKDCIHRLDDSTSLGNTSSCKVYPWKPDNVITGGSCNEYKSER